jgi:hypothetical protein
LSDDQFEQRDDELLEQQGELPLIAPADSASAARSCQAILLIMLFLAFIVCVAAGVTLLR